MLVLEPVVDARLNVIYVTQTFTRWHGGVAREDYADTWLEQTGPLTGDEVGAVEVLGAAFCAEEGGGCDLIRALVRADPAIDASVRRAADALAPRAARIAEAAEPALRYWEQRLRGPFPVWFDCVRRGMDRFFGAEGPHPLRVYLLPSAPGNVSGNGDMFVEAGATNLDCSGAPPQSSAVLEIALHEAVHSIYQPRFVAPLVEAVLSAPYGRAVEGLRRRSPMPIDLPSYVGELVAYSLDPGGALGERCGAGSNSEHWRSMLERGRRILTDPTFTGFTHDAWTGLGAAQMVPLVAAYLDQGRTADTELIRQAFGIFEATYHAWAAAQALNAPERIGR